MVMTLAAEIKTSETIEDEQLLCLTIEVYEDALLALERQDTPLLNTCLRNRRRLLERIKSRSTEGWERAPLDLLQPLFEELRDAEARFIKALDSSVNRMRDEMMVSREHRKARQVYGASGRKR
jgi:hypothetical protein